MDLDDHTTLVSSQAGAGSSGTVTAPRASEVVGSDSSTSKPSAQAASSSSGSLLPTSAGLISMDEDSTLRSKRGRENDDGGDQDAHLDADIEMSTLAICECSITEDFPINFVLGLEDIEIFDVR